MKKPNDPLDLGGYKAKHTLTELLEAGKLTSPGDRRLAQYDRDARRSYTEAQAGRSQPSTSEKKD